MLNSKYIFNYEAEISNECTGLEKFIIDYVCV